MKAWLAWIAGAIAFVLIFYALLYTLYARHVMQSAFIQDLKRQSAAYDCIGAVLDPKRPRARAAVWVARHYMRTGEESGPPRTARSLNGFAAYWVIERSTGRAEVNRMYAAVPNRAFDGFDAIARRYAGVDYCALDSKRRQAVIEFYRGGRRFDFEAAMRPEPGA